MRSYNFVAEEGNRNGSNSQTKEAVATVYTLISRQVRFKYPSSLQVIDLPYNSLLEQNVVSRIR